MRERKLSLSSLKPGTLEGKQPAPFSKASSQSERSGRLEDLTPTASGSTPHEDLSLGIESPETDDEERKEVDNAANELPLNRTNSSSPSPQNTEVLAPRESTVISQKTSVQNDPLQNQANERDNRLPGSPKRTTDSPKQETDRERSDLSAASNKSSLKKPVEIDDTVQDAPSKDPAERKKTKAKASQKQAE